MREFKKLNDFEIYGLEKLLEEVFPFITYQTVGTCNNNLKNIQNTDTGHNFNSKYYLLGAYGLTIHNDIVLEYWDEEENNSKYYYTSFKEVREWISYSLDNMDEWLDQNACKGYYIYKENIVYNEMAIKPFNTILTKLD